MTLEVGAPRSGLSRSLGVLSLGETIGAVRTQIAEAATAAGRDAASIRLLVVTKGHPRELVAAAIELGVTEIGENYVQEARTKYAELPQVRKHYIGHIQTNKAKAIVQTFDVVQSIDRVDAARAIGLAARALNKPVTALVQVNVSPAERFGIAPEDAPALAAAAREHGVTVDGVMAIGPLTSDRAAIRLAFRRAAEAFARVGGTTLSIGMSSDFREAIACGSTMVRIGTSVFGARS